MGPAGSLQFLEHYDLRTPLDVSATPYAIPGSHWLAADAIDEHEAGILRDRDLVLYCACNKIATAGVGESSETPLHQPHNLSPIALLLSGPGHE